MISYDESGFISEDSEIYVATGATGFIEVEIKVVFHTQLFMEYMPRIRPVLPAQAAQNPRNDLPVTASGIC